MAHSTRKTVLVTGVTGHVGFSVLINALNAGYNVRATVRSEAKEKAILSHPQIQYADSNSRLSLIVIPNIAKTHAFDEVAQGVDYIIHIASPIATAGSVNPADYESHFIRTAVHGTLNVLGAAAKSTTVRRVVLTSSIVALIPLAQLEGRERQPKPVSPSDRVPFPTAPYKDEFEAYAASKIAALSIAEKWVKTRKSRFDVVFLYPGFVEGRNHLASNKKDMLKGTNTIITGIALGNHFGSFIGATIHNEDVATAHIRALDASVPGNTGYILSQPSRWNDIKHIAKKHFPGAVASRAFPLTGSASTLEIEVDTTLTEQVFDIAFKSFEDQVVDVLGHYLELQPRSKRCNDSLPTPKAVQHTLQAA